MELYRQITVDLYNPYPLYVMNAKQGDTARGALITLTADGNIIELTAEKVRVYAKKKDGTKLYNDCTVENGKIKVKFTNQLLAIPGELPVELEMIHGSDILSSPIFEVNILPGNIDSQAVESSDEFTALQNALQKAENAEGVAEHAATRALNAAAQAESAADTVQKKLDNGEFIGPRGPEGMQGEIGLQGPMGPTGKTGAQGPQGVKGETGAAGPQGPIGLTGAAGPQGSRGPEGQQGETGPQGPKGATGPAGPAGAQGIQGIKGEKGDKGDRGDSGITTPISGLYSLSGDEEGNLWAYYAEGNTSPKFETDINGNIYYITPEE